ncbi:Lacal_2735 family protein [Maribacter sp. X9]|uniref:Lacal_2735 family protein n=1 Tax=Maribacter sp. X9 TaxID=3402159 RepID=UPI003AF3D4B6
MFGLFKKKTEREKLQAQYEKLMKESYQLSTVNRSKSDDKAAEADAIMKQMEGMEN